eukprot:TRINITY_DN26853_c0_g1_i1.p1 TRINITY_DN26853_c0_g1~~TRINITY_DN26853_c0_g1_i1.p1  ORF type:complete len:134 (-),score=3.67 TRINITY_DN26853_c0_g1_i1:88-489(-)
MSFVDYKVIVRTADKSAAGTNSRVYIELKGPDASGSGQLATTGKIRLDSPANDFEQGSEGEYRFTGPAMKVKTCTLYWEYENSDHSPGWYPEWVRVYREFVNSWQLQCQFDFNEWIGHDDMSSDSATRTIEYA